MARRGTIKEGVGMRILSRVSEVVSFPPESLIGQADIKAVLRSADIFELRRAMKQGLFINYAAVSFMHSVLFVQILLVHRHVLNTVDPLNFYLGDGIRKDVANSQILLAVLGYVHKLKLMS